MLRLRRIAFLGLAGIALATEIASGEPLHPARVSIGRHLTVKSAGPSVCPAHNVFFPGQPIRIHGSGFDHGAVVTIYFGVGDADADLAVLGSATADASGALNATVTIPAGLSTPTLAMMEARGPTSRKTLYLSALLPLASSSGPDVDSDTVPDVCDDCREIANAGQEDDDHDGIGNVCDACPLDSVNDSDGDGQCRNTDVCPFSADNDVDGDGRCGDEDNCPKVANADQKDWDQNDIGDACQKAPTCSDGIDNDRDGLSDHPSDPGCSDATDGSETNPALHCDDGFDNDEDGWTDYRRGGTGDPGCGSGGDTAEDPQCDDGIDNDGDGKFDWDGDNQAFEADPECHGAGSATSESPPAR